MRHLQGDLQLPNAALPKLGRAVRGLRNDTETDVMFQDQDSAQHRAMVIAIMSDNMAAKLCAAHFAAGYDVETALKYLLADWTGVKPVQAAQRHALNSQREVDDVQKTVRLHFNGTWSQTWKFVDDRFGCTLANSSFFELATVQLPSRQTAGPKASSTPSKSRRTPASEVNWGALDRAAERLEDADPSVQDFVRGVMSSPLASSVAVLHRGRLVESYCGACNVTQRTRQPGNSLGKSVEAMLMVQRLEELGRSIDSDTSVPEIDEGTLRSRGMSVRNLMNMIVGWPADEEDVRLVGRVSFDAAAYAATIENRVPVGVGTYFYSTGNYHILSRELRYSLVGPYVGTDEQSAAEVRYADFPWSHLFNPIGAKSFSCERDLSGTVLYGTSCWATTRDWMKIGLLMLNKGRGAGGEQVVPAWMVDDIYGDDEGYGANGHYVHGWYRLDRLFGWRGCGPIVAAYGVGGNKLIIVPGQDLVLIRQSWRVAGDGGGFMDEGNYGAGYFKNLLSSLHC